MKCNHWMLAGLALVAMDAQAQSADSWAERLATPYYAAALPQPGAYFDPEHPGTGMFVDIRKDGAIFVHIGVYDELGKPTWYLIQDRFNPSFAYPLNTFGVPILESFYRAPTIGDVVAPIYRAEGGQCLGCSYTAPEIQVAEELGTATLSWSNTGNVRVFLLDRWIEMMRLPLDGTDADRIEGTWRMQAWSGGTTPASQYPDERGRFVDSVVEIRRANEWPPMSIVAYAYGSQEYYPDVTDRYAMTCLSGCDGDLWHSLQPGGASSMYESIAPFIWLASNGAAGLEQYGEMDNGGLSLPAFRYVFSFHVAGDVMWARRAHKSSNSAGVEVAQPIDGSLVKFERIAQ